MNKINRRRALAVLGTCIFMGCEQKKGEEQKPELHIQNIFEIQELLAKAGYYKGSIDGKWGRQTDLAYANWCASRSFKGEKKR